MSICWKIVYLACLAPGVCVCVQDNGKAKSSSYECFHAHDDIITVAVFAPDIASRASDAPSSATGQVILTAGYSGEIKVFENLPMATVQ